MAEDRKLMRNRRCLDVDVAMILDSLWETIITIYQKHENWLSFSYGLNNNLSSAFNKPDYWPYSGWVFLGLLTVGRGQKVPLPIVCHTYPTIMKLGTIIPYLKKIQKYINHITHSIFHRKLAIQKNRTRLYFII